MDDPVSRLLEAIAAKEEKAHAAIAEAASRDDPEGVAVWYASDGGLYYEDTNNCFATGPYGGDVPVAARTLIADNDPSSALRRCAADRRIVERHRPRVAVEGPCEGSLVCGCSNGQDEWYATPFPCDDVRDLAEGYGLEVTE